MLALTDALGNLVRFALLPGQRGEITGVPELIEGLTFHALRAPSPGLQANHCRATDKAFDANHLREELHRRGADAVIPAKCHRILHIPHDAYKWRHIIENYFSKIKEFRGVNTRYDKTDTSYRATWNIAATILALR